MSIGCSSSCCTAPFQRYTERHGARMLTQAASCFSTSRSASRSAAERSGRLVNTKSVLMPQSFIDGRVAQAHAEHLLHAPVVEATRFAHERIKISRGEIGHLCTGYALGPRQAGVLGDEVKPVAHLHFRGVSGALGRDSSTRAPAQSP